MPFETSQETGGPVTIKDEGISIHDNISSIDFVGGGVGGAAVGSAITETIPGASAASGNGETPSGTINGSNKVFTLAETPSPAASLVLIRGRAIMVQGTDYTLVTNTITYTVAPPTGTIHRAWYKY